MQQSPVRISAFHVIAAPTIDIIKHIGDKDMLYVSALSVKCDFIIQSSMMTFLRTLGIANRVGRRNLPWRSGPAH